MSMSPEDLLIVQIAAALGTILGASLLVARVIFPIMKSAKKIIDQVDDFMEDWKGTETREGRIGTPGVMARLNKIDGELSHNGGSSIKDAVDRIEKKIKEIDDRLEIGDKEFDKIEHRLDDIDKNK